ncbi:MAG TPA: AAA family ATPase [bacterium]|nr:AAA family ATPase [bacterium]HNS34091.1 AAA family ATPase [bacterium]
MYLQRIELQGFKSFAQKTVLEFPTPGRGCEISPRLSGRPGQLGRGVCGVTSIVGPNGSGKSNIVDAVRWVLGEQSLKLLRGKKSTDVIFAGSANKAQMSLAEVSLYLNNEDKSAPIDYSEVVITRRLYRDGNSQYLLNKSEVRLFDIVMLLAKANFGQNTYSVIGQGMVDRIVNYSSQERKEFFDEATGVKQFQIKRDRSVNKLRRSRENWEQAQGLLNELDPRLKSLTRQVNRLRKRKEVEVELRQEQIKYYGRLWLDLDQNYQEQAIIFNSRDKEKIKIEGIIEELTVALDELGQERGRAENFDRLQNDHENLSARRNSLLQQLAQIKGQLDVEYLKIGKQDLTWQENRQDDLKLELKNINLKVSELEAQIGRYQLALDDKNRSQQEVLKEFKRIEERLLELQKEFRSGLGVSDKEIRQAINRIYALQKDFINKIKTTHDLTGLSQLKAEAEAVFSEVEGFYQKISLEDKKQQTEEMASLQERLSEFLRSKDFLVNEINELKIKLGVASSQKQSLLAQRREIDQQLQALTKELAKNKLQPKDQNGLTNQLKANRQQVEQQIEELEKILVTAKQKIDQFNEAEEDKKRQIFSLQQKIHQEQVSLNRIVGDLNEVKVALARIETKKEDLFASIRRDLGEDYRPKIERELKRVDIAEQEQKIFKLKRQLELIGGTDPEVEKEYQEVKDRHDFLSQQSEDLGDAIRDLEKVVVELDKIIKKKFEEEFRKINKDFSRYFKQLFEGGGAKLILAEKELTEAEVAREEVAEVTAGADSAESEPTQTASQPAAPQQIEDKSSLADMGIDIEVCPPGKKIKNINVLSGGEKTMTALALICAIIANNPSPFILFDEVDAALDESNSAKFSNIIEELAHKTQFIIITHNRAIMARANVLYGVTMQGDGISRLIGLKLDQAEKLTKEK